MNAEKLYSNFSSILIVKHFFQIYNRIEQKYYFYIGVLQNDLISDWTLAEATPVTPKPLSNAYYDSLNSNSIINNDSSAVLEKSQVVEAKVEVAVPKIELPKYFVSFYTMGKYIFFKSFQSLK